MRNKEQIHVNMQKSVSENVSKKFFNYHLYYYYLVCSFLVTVSSANTFHSSTTLLLLVYIWQIKFETWNLKVASRVRLEILIAEQNRSNIQLDISLVIYLSVLIASIVLALPTNFTTTQQSSYSGTFLALQSKYVWCFTRCVPLTL